MIKRDMFVRAATVLHEEIRQQTLLEDYMADYFGVDSTELQRKYQDSSLNVLMQLLCKLVDDDGILMDWLYDNYDRKEGLSIEVKTPCGKDLEMELKTPNDLYDYFVYQKADSEKKCRICRKLNKKHGIMCEEES